MTPPTTIEPAGLPLSDERLNELFDLGRVPEEGRELVREIRRSLPVRAVQGGRRRVAVRFPSRKMGLVIKCESRTVEYPCALMMEIDPKVLEYWDQPAKLHYSYLNSAGVRSWHFTIPDFFFVSEGRMEFAECKSGKTLQRLIEENPARWQRGSDGSWRSIPCEEAAKKLGLDYRVWTPQSAPWALLENSRFLEDFLREDFEHPDESRVERILSLVHERQAISVGSLVDETRDADGVFALIVHRRIFVDLERDRLADRDTTLAFPDEQKARIWRLASEEDDQAEQIRPAPTDSAAAILMQTSDERLHVAQERYQILKPVIDGEVMITQIEGARQRTAAEWWAHFKKAKKQHGSGFVGLIPQTHLRGYREPRLPDKILGLMDKAARDFESPRGGIVQGAYTLLTTLCKKDGEPTPSYWTLCNHLRKQPEFLQKFKRLGYKAAVAANPGFPEVEQTMDKNGTRPFDRIHIDHTLLDLAVCLCDPPLLDKDQIEQLLGKKWAPPVERPWLTTAICAWSKAIVGFSLSFHEPSYVSLMAVFRDMVRRHGYLPKTVITDNASEFGSAAFALLCATYGIEHWSRPTSEPRFGAISERMFGTINTQIIHGLAGCTKNLQNPRQLSPQIDPYKDAKWLLPDLRIYLDWALTDGYGIQSHPKTGEPPKYRLAHGLLQTGEREHTKISFDRLFHVLTLPPPAPRQTTVKVSRQATIQVANIVFGSEKLRPFKAKKVNVRVDPDDAGVAWAYPISAPLERQEWIECRSEYFAKLGAMSRKTARLLSTIIKGKAGKGRKSPRAVAAAMGDILTAARNYQDSQESEDVRRQLLRDEAHRQTNAEAAGKTGSCVDPTGPIPVTPAPLPAETGLGGLWVAPDRSTYREPESVATVPIRPTQSWDDVPEPEEMNR